uniref:Uncharacterized protein n=1 Tax=Anguilla anguilla TaxID=7936 RepID=A0A0E9WL02_ANGAN
MRLNKFQGENAIKYAPLSICLLLDLFIDVLGFNLQTEQ